MRRTLLYCCYTEQRRLGKWREIRYAMKWTRLYCIARGDVCSYTPVLLRLHSAVLNVHPHNDGLQLCQQYHYQPNSRSKTGRF